MKKKQKKLSDLETIITMSETGSPYTRWRIFGRPDLDVRGTWGSTWEENSMKYLIDTEIRKLKTIKKASSIPFREARRIGIKVNACITFLDSEKQEFRDIGFALSNKVLAEYKKILAKYSDKSKGFRKRKNITMYN